ARWCFDATFPPDTLRLNGVGPQALGYESGLVTDWKWHAGRSLVFWQKSFNAVGLNPYQLLTEIGVVGSPDRGRNLFASAGWRDSITYGGNWSIYETDLLQWQSMVREYGDIVRAGTIFTVGDDFVGWDKFKLKYDQMTRLAQVL
ncbi:unnamed protein product, partial [marine sediment metagenome]